MKITLCGSTRFIDQFHSWNRYLTLLGHTVYSVATSVKHDWKPTDDEKLTLDLVHLAKIEESDAILIITTNRNPNELHKDTPYMGDSTFKELAWAKMRHKGVFLTNTLDIETILGKRTNLLEL